MPNVLHASWGQLRAWALMRFVALCAIGWFLVGGSTGVRAEGSQLTARVADQPAGEDSSSVEAGALAARPIPEASLIHAKDLAEALDGPVARRPTVLHVGYRALYRGGHIAGSRYVGPASKPEGLQALREAVRKLPRKRSVVLYCGCCPWADCPNVRPAYAAVKSSGRAVRILYIARNLQKDWIDAGLPTENGDR